jgi:hypothetical protein
MRQLPRSADLVISTELGAGGEDILVSLPLIETPFGIPSEELRLRAWEKLTGGIIDRLEALRGRLCDNTPTAIAINKLMEELKAS